MNKDYQRFVSVQIGNGKVVQVQKRPGICELMNLMYKFGLHRKDVPRKVKISVH